MYGWAGNVLKVDLTRGEVKREAIPEEILYSYLGGEGLGVRYLYDETPPGLDPCHENMAFIVACGPLNGTLAPSCGRLEVVSKSPLTGILGDSNVGGEFSPELHWAGYEAIVVKGKAEKPVYLWINDDEVQIRDASHLWGRPHREAIDIVQKELGDPFIKTVSVGPAAENGVAFACTYVDYHSAAASTGVAVVMASKNLKLIAVRGTKGVRIADPRGFEKACIDVAAKNKTARVYETMAEQGALGVVTWTRHQIAAEPVRNWQENVMSEEDFKQIGYEGFAKYKTKNLACFGCHVHCKHFCRIDSGPYAGIKMKGVEFFASDVFGANIGVFDSSFYIKCTWDCDIYGMDMGGVGAALAFASELYQRGIITKADTDGLELTWGNQDAYLKMIKKIAYKEGFGALFAGGMDMAAQKIGEGAERYKIAVGNSTVISADPRIYTGCALQLLTSTRAGDELKSGMYVELGEGSVAKLAEKAGQQYFGIPSLAPQAVEGKEKAVIYFENLFAIASSLVLCTFVSRWFIGLKAGTNEDDYARLLTLATGREYSGKELLSMGERMYRLQMAYNAREGVKRDHPKYKLPVKFLREPIKTGPYKGAVANMQVMDKLLDSYLERRGFDPKSGLPTRKGLEEVGLGRVADELENLGAIA